MATYRTLIPLFSVLVGFFGLPHIAWATCTTDDFYRSLKDHDRAGLEFQWKMKTGYLPSKRSGTTTGSQERHKFLSEGAEAAIKGIQAHLKALDANGRTAALIYDLKADGCVWLLRSTGMPEGERTAISPNLAKNVRDEMGVTTLVETRMPRLRSASAKSAAPAPPARIASREYLAGVRDAVIPPRLFQIISSNVKRLLVLPSGDVAAIPFAAFPSNVAEQLLIDTTSVTYLPGFDSLVFWVNAPTKFRGASAMIVGDPELSKDPIFEWIPLPAARREAESVARKLNTKALTGAEAKLDNVRAALKGPPALIYFATHGISDAQNPMDESFLALHGEHLRAAQIKNMGFPSSHPLVVMSACQTGLGKQFSGGIFGLARAWIYAGASQVVASQWDVSDGATAYLLENFVDRLVDGVGSEEALRLATLRTSKRYPNPAHWASFHVFGYAQPQ